ncbi:MAG: type VI secretion system membrane subunit TssM [Burkholderiales bacterium]|jgi:type VI secretion system protein ImpL|nr:type VI secretion system membrane subunit TssM [Burkholderiales bacterium]
MNILWIEWLFRKIFIVFSGLKSGIGSMLSSPKTFVVVGLIAFFIIMYLYTGSLPLTVYWFLIVLAAVIVLWILSIIWRKFWSARSGKKLTEQLSKQSDGDKPATHTNLDGGKTAKTNLLEAVQTIKTSKIGQLSGNAALYELPWYIIIGNPSAGKSSAITHSGLQFPLDKSGAPVKGVGGTRNCDWFFTSEGIILDTAGRYATEEQDRAEWLDFLDLLKRHRSKAPINGIIVAASVSELMSKGPNFAIDLAKHLRQRIQEMTERLEVVAPVYVFFTKIDLLAGFTEFFANEEDLRDHPWGATFTYPANNEDKRDLSELFSMHFDELYHGLKEMSVSQVSRQQKNVVTQGMLTFPFQFAAIKPILQTFLDTFFENNPFQYKPIFRGFYFTSALQEGDVQDTATERLNKVFSLTPVEVKTPHRLSSNNGFFLKNLFSKIILADKHLVRQNQNPGRLKARYAVFFTMVALLGLLLGGWCWSFLSNQQLVGETQEDLDAVLRVQAERVDLESRFEAMEILQRRIEYLDAMSADRPIGYSLGLYQGERIKHQLLTEYYHGLRQFMIEPVKTNLEDFLKRVDLHPGIAQLGDPSSSSASEPALFQDASPNDVEDSYNALKTYLMMANRAQVEPTFLSDHVTNNWRMWLESNRGAMPRDQMIRSAQRLISFYVSRTGEEEWPEITTNIALVEKDQAALRAARRGMPARERIYSTIRARAANRFPPMTVPTIVGESQVDLIAGNYTVPGTFTRRAWLEFIEPSFRSAAGGELQTTDWVLGVRSVDDLTVEDNPEQAFKALSAMYKKEYVAEWKKFLQSVSVRPFTNFPTAAERMNRLGNPEASPLEKLLVAVYEQTSWDNPKISLSEQKSGILNWIKQKLAKKPAAVTAAGNADEMLVNTQFAEIARLLQKQEKQPSLLNDYMTLLGKVRTRFNLIQNEGDPGPGALKFLRETFEGKDSELSDAMRFIDEQVLTGLSEEQRTTLRPLLVRPLVQAFAALIPPAETELNKIWLSQVYEPFNQRLSQKYPFSVSANIEADAMEVSSIFGPDGAIAQFVTESLSPLTIRRGNIMTSRTWGDMGINIHPAFTANFVDWIAPVDGAAGGAGGGGGGGGQPQTVFQIQPKPVANAIEYTIEIDGQQIRYRNSPPYWANFVWPNPQGSPGVKITATLPNGQVLTIVNEPGRFGLEKLISSARRVTNPDGTHTMSWTSQNVTVSVVLRIISSSNNSAAGGKAGGGSGLRGLRLPNVVVGDVSASNSNKPVTRNSR